MLFTTSLYIFIISNNGFLLLWRRLCDPAQLPAAWPAGPWSLLAVLLISGFKPAGTWWLASPLFVVATLWSVACVWPLLYNSFKGSWSWLCGCFLSGQKAGRATTPCTPPRTVTRSPPSLFGDSIGPSNFCLLIDWLFSGRRWRCSRLRCWHKEGGPLCLEAELREQLSFIFRVI